MKNAREITLRLLKYATAGVAGTLCIFAALAAFLRVTGNFHVVENGALYRSAQPSGDDLKRYTQRWGIKTIINFCDLPSDQARNLDPEAKAAKALGLEYVRYPLSAARLLTASQIAEVIGMMSDLPKPILVHSYFGSDRAGLASALYLYAIGGRSARDALAQLSPSFGHLPYLGIPTSAMDETLEAVIKVGAPDRAAR